jgi:transposase
MLIVEGISVEKYVRNKYVLPEEEKIVIGELTTLPIPRGNAGAGLLSHLLISKFVEHLPFTARYSSSGDRILI